MKVKLTVGKGMDEYLQKLGNLEFTASETIGKAVYEGADIVADAIKANIKKIPVDEKYHRDDKLKGLKKIQVIGLEKSFGIAKAQNNSGYYNVKAGFDGYNNLKTKKWPKGQPNVMIARTIESGNSITQKHPFVGPAVRATREIAELKMQSVIDSEISKKMS